MVIDPAGGCANGRIVADPGPDGAYAFWAICGCGWQQKGRSSCEADAEVALAEHEAAVTVTHPAVPVAAAPVVSYELDGWQVIRQQAETLARSAMVPKDFRGKPDEIIAAALYGREVGFGVTTSLSYIQVINGKAGLSAEAMVALCRKAGHSISGKSTATEAHVVGKRSDTGDEMEVTWTIDMAKRAGLGSDTWRKYPEAMLWARAVSQLCRSLFPDVIMGLSYTPEELNDFTPGPTPAPGREPAQESGSPGRNVSSAPALTPGPAGSPSLEAEGQVGAPPGPGYVDTDGVIHVPKAQCSECNAPAGKPHATKCSRRDPAA